MMPSDCRDQVLAGPILRRVTAERFVLWLVTRQALPAVLHLQVDDTPQCYTLDATRCRTLRVGEQALIHLLDVALDPPLPDESVVAYDLLIRHGNRTLGIADWGTELCYPGEALPRFRYTAELDRLLHGSCRKPHYPSDDALVRADAWISERRADPRTWPALLLLTGDQIYADDVAGPMLAAIHELIDELGLLNEQLRGAV
ncbi:MAG: hypothetical protein R3202_12540, partial [Candidatus Competibacterales bacterium]|nr:hypothetical protein [Candidatus Competibacterales bacterium]